MKTSLPQVYFIFEWLAHWKEFIIKRISPSPIKKFAGRKKGIGSQLNKNFLSKGKVQRNVKDFGRYIIKELKIKKGDYFVERVCRYRNFIDLFYSFEWDTPRYLQNFTLMLTISYCFGFLKYTSPTH